MTFVLTCIYVFLLFLRPQDWLVPQMAVLQPLDIVAVLAMGCCAAEIMQDQIRPMKKLPHLWLMVGLFGAVLMSHVYHTYYAGFMVAFEEFGKIFIVTVLVLLCVDTVRKLRILTFLVVGMALFISAHCILQVKTGYGFAGVPPLVVYAGSETEQIRAQFFGIFGDPNDTSLFLVAAIPLVLAVVPWRGIVCRCLSTAAVATLCVGVYATQSRGGFLGFGVMLLTFLRRFLSVKQFIGAAAVGVLLLTVVAPSRLVETGLLEESATDRAVFWGEANYAFKKTPLFGVGYGMITEYVQKDRAIHNSYVQAYADLGVLGYIFWFGLLLIALVGCWQIGTLQPDTEEERQLVRWANFAVPGLAGLYASAYFLSRTYHLPLYVILGMCGAAYNISGIRVGFDQLNSFCGIDRKRAWLGPALAVASIVFIYGSILLINRIR